MAAGQPGPVQARGPGQRPGPVHGHPAGLPDKFPHQDLLVVDGRQGRRGAEVALHKVAPWRWVDWVAVIKITSFV